MQSISAIDKAPFIKSNVRIVIGSLYYIGKTKRWFVTRRKEHMRDDTDLTALSKHASQLEHCVDWDNYEILDIETDYAMRKFIKSLFINNNVNILNDKNWMLFPQMYYNL